MRRFCEGTSYTICKASKLSASCTSHLRANELIRVIVCFLFRLSTGSERKQIHNGCRQGLSSLPNKESRPRSQPRERERAETGNRNSDSAVNSGQRLFMKIRWHHRSRSPGELIYRNRKLQQTPTATATRKLPRKWLLTLEQEVVDHVALLRTYAVTRDSNSHNTTS